MSFGQKVGESNNLITRNVKFWAKCRSYTGNYIVDS